ncbi:YpoC family protein [Bacillus dakarensis]|uniref:YpoC family protein n=1 Tax=Robertmurraya dakarensis TaxID=1926278 RepID=UPI0009FDAD2E|nr:hypothetical protein [Bacillus dakarensis]
MSIKTFEVPKELGQSYFFPEKIISEEIDELDHFNVNKIFIYDAAFYVGIQALKPWEENEASISALLTEWPVLRDQLKINFKNRDLAGAKEPMKKGIGLFIEMMHWTNGTPVKLSPEIVWNNLAVKPVNVRERLDFILRRPVFYPSYMQLIELMIEMEKLYKKSIAIKKSV